MSMFKDLIVDVEEMYDAGFDPYDISSQLLIPAEQVEEIMCYIDEQRYHEDMKRNPWQGLVA